MGLIGKPAVVVGVVVALGIRGGYSRDMLIAGVFWFCDAGVGEAAVVERVGALVVVDAAGAGEADGAAVAVVDDGAVDEGGDEGRAVGGQRGWC